MKKIFKKAIKKGHFLLASGYHSEYYFQGYELLKYPRIASKLGKEISKMWNKDDIDVVVSLAVGGIVLGHEVARALNKRHIFLERKNKEFSLERGFKLKEGERVLLVEDVVTTGGSLKEAIRVLKKYKVRIVGITALLLRGNVKFRYPFKTLLKLKIEKYKPENCPLCRRNVPLSIPGTKQKK
ncbi:MAG: orotate phosphoribosyltransferase [Caldiserica bacterium]|nr:MAG: orotate phosphoribosyltransferase [Caldisericota bacterium]